MRFPGRAAVLLLLLSLFITTSLRAQAGGGTPALPHPHPCEGDPAYYKLDFWVGNWKSLTLDQSKRSG